MTNMTALAGGQVVAARYELARPLAAGHDGATWLARDTQANRDVVLRFRTGGDVAGERIHAVVEHPTLLAPLATHSCRRRNLRRLRLPARAERSAACADVPGR